MSREFADYVEWKRIKLVVAAAASWTHPSHEEGYFNIEQVVENLSKQQLLTEGVACLVRRALCWAGDDKVWVTS